MRTLNLVIGSLLMGSPFLSLAAMPAPEAPLIVDGPIVVDARDVDAYLLRVPEERRGDFRISYDRVASVADATFISRSLAAKAKELGLDRDPAVQRRLQQVQEAFLADLYSQRIRKDAITVNLDKRARELYVAERNKYVTAEHVWLHHILIDLKGRTREMAMERAREVHAKAKAGEDFLSLAARYSDDPNKSRNGGNLGYMSPKSFAPSVQEAIAKLKAKGEISEPVESEHGFQIVLLRDRKPPTPVKFEDVQHKIVAAEKERLQKERLDTEIQNIRSSSTVVTHRPNVEALVIPLDPAAMARVNEAHKLIEKQAMEQQAPK